MSLSYEPANPEPHEAPRWASQQITAVAGYLNEQAGKLTNLAQHGEHSGTTSKKLNKSIQHLQTISEKLLKIAQVPSVKSGESTATRSRDWSAATITGAVLSGIGGILILVAIIMLALQHLTGLIPGVLGFVLLVIGLLLFINSKKWIGVVALAAGIAVAFIALLLLGILLF